MKAGLYWIGDLCYVLEDEWDEVCRLTIQSDQVLDGEFKLSDGRSFCMFSTRYGDGYYKDQIGRGYGVDSGTIGCIRAEDIGFVITVNETKIRGGNLVRFSEDFTASGNDGDDWDGTIQFGYLNIYTGDTEEEEENYEYEDEP